MIINTSSQHSHIKFHHIKASICYMIGWHEYHRGN